MHGNLKFACVAAALVLAIAGSAYAAESNAAAHAAAISAAHKTAPHPLVAAPLVTNSQTAVPANICYTCGGDWPIYAGTIPTSAAATERGAGCSGAFGTSMNDRIPFLCTR